MKSLLRFTKFVSRFVVRVVVFFTLLIALAAGTAYVALRMLATPEGLRSIFITQLQEVFHRPVQIRDVNVMLSQGIRIRGLKVLESTDFPGGEFLSSEVLLAKYDWRALLHRRLDITELRLVAPRIQITRRQDGRWNLEDIFVSVSTRSAAAAGPLALPVSLAAEVIAVDHGVMTVSDLKRRELHVIQAFNLESRHFDPDHPFPVSASFQNNNNVQGRKVDLHVSLQGALDLASFVWPKAEFTAEKLRLTVDGEPVSATGSVKDFSRPVIDVKLKLPRLDSALLSRYYPVPRGIFAPATLWRARLKIPEPGALRLVSLEGASETLRLKASASLDIKPSSRKFKLAVSAPQTPLKEIAPLWEGLAKYQLAGSAGVAVSLSGDLSENGAPASIDKLSLDLKGFGGLFFKDKRVSGADLRIDAADNLDAFSATAARGTFVAYSNAFSDIDLALQVNKGDLDVERLNFTWSASHLKLKGTVQGMSAPKEVQVEGSVDKLDINETVDAVANIVSQIKPSTPKPEAEAGRLWSRVFKYAVPKTFPATRGKLRVSQVTHSNFETQNLEVQWDLRGISTGLDRLDGNIRAGFGGGRVTNIPELQKAHKILFVVFLPFVFMHKLNNASVGSFATAIPKTLDFTKINGEYGLKNGVVDTHYFHVDSGQMVAFADGAADFPKEKVDMHLLMRLTKGRGELAEYLNDERGRPSLEFFVRGDLNKPDVDIPFHKMKATAIEDAFAEALKRRAASFTMLKAGN